MIGDQWTFWSHIAFSPLAFLLGFIHLVADHPALLAFLLFVLFILIGLWRAHKLAKEDL